MSFVPNSYEEWKHCITVKCDIPLTGAYIDERLNALANDGDYQTQKFKERWGDKHLARTIGWFERAKVELGASS